MENPCFFNSFLLFLYLLSFTFFSYVEGYEFALQSVLFRDAENLVKSRSIVLSVDYFGAKGDGFSDDTEAFKYAWEEACSFPFRSELRVPSGKTYLVSSIEFAGPCQSKVTFSIAGTIIAPQNINAWDGLNPQRWLYFRGIEHLTVDGGGIIHGMGYEWWNRSCKHNKTNPCMHAPTAVTFHRTNELEVRDLTLVDSQQMHMAFTNCHSVKASHLKVIAPFDSPNTDGVHISSSTRVEIEHSIIGTGDDCISIVSNSSSIQIRNITCGPGHGISIGSLGKWNSEAQIFGVFVKGAFLSNTQNGLRIKTWQGGTGYARNISFEDVEMKNVSYPIIINQYYCDSLLPCTNQTSSVKVDEISFTRITGTSATNEAIRFACSDNFPCENLHLEDIILFHENYGENTNSYCWNAFGFSSGLVYPSPCFAEFKSLTNRISYLIVRYIINYRKYLWTIVNMVRSVFI